MKCVDACFCYGEGDATKQAEVSLPQITLTYPDKDSITVDPTIDPASSDANNIGELLNATVTPNASRALQQL